MFIFRWIMSSLVPAVGFFGCMRLQCRCQRWVKRDLSVNLADWIITQLLWYIWYIYFDIVFIGISDSWNKLFQPLWCLCVCMCALYASAVIQYMQAHMCVSAWCPKQSDAPADSAPLALCPAALSVSASSGDWQDSLVWLHKGPASFEVLKTSILCISLDKKAPSPFESSSNTGRHCGHASRALTSQILKPVCGEQDLRG